jgi:two-component system, NtrC family, response regulator AtoC
MEVTMRILLVDDDPIARRLIAGLLVARGHMVDEREAAIGTSAHVANSQPDVVLLDVTMPGLAGDALATLLRRHAPTTPVVLISGLPEARLSLLTLTCGAIGYLRKSDARMIGPRLEALVRAASGKP